MVSHSMDFPWTGIDSRLGKTPEQIFAVADPLQLPPVRGNLIKIFRFAIMAFIEICRYN